MSRAHNELSEVVVTATAYDINGAQQIPATAKYKVDDCSSEKSLVPWTTLTPSLSMDIVIPGSVNAIVNDRNRIENKVVTVNINEGLDSQHYENYIYKIKNLSFVK